MNSFVDFDSNTDETYIVLEVRFKIIIYTYLKYLVNFTFPKVNNHFVFQMKQEDDAYYCSLFYWLGSKSPPVKLDTVHTKN